MNPDPAEHLLHDLLSAAPQQRREQLAALRDSDPDHAERVEKLLAMLEGIGFLDDPDATAPGLPERIGEYRILRLLGTGGMGVVYVAEHETLGRRVALKVIHEDLARTPRARERFHREAVAATRLDHPNICTVYEAGSDGDTLFLAMRLVPGQSLARHLEHSRQRRADVAQLPAVSGDRADAGIDATLRLVERTALALHTAHDAGLVHRDVKPGNLVVTPDGEPVLLDFGLARIVDGSADGITRSGDELGTPIYMAPEQIAGGIATRTTDVYALGVVLYECLTLQPPFSGLNRESLFHQILREEPRDPRRSNRAIGSELWTVLQTALAKEPARRYPTAAAFAEDLRRLRAREPILAKPPGPWLRLRRFAQRHPAAAALLVVSIVAAVGFAVLFGQRGAALAAKETALAQQQQALTEKSAIELALRANGERRHAPVEALDHALHAWKASDNTDTRSALYMAMAESRERVRLWHDAAVWRVLFSPDGRHVVTCSDDWTARLWDRQGNLLHVLPHDRWVQDCRFSHSGTRIATAARDGTAAIWKLDGEREHELVHAPLLESEYQLGRIDNPARAAYLWSVRWSHDDRYVATSAADGKIRVWDAMTGQLVGDPFSGHVVDVRAGYCRIAWSPRESLLATCRGNMAAKQNDPVQKTTVFVWRPRSDQHEIVERFVHPAAVNAVEFAPDGRHLLTGCADGRVRIWDLDRQDGPIPTEQVGDVVIDACFTANGRYVLASSLDRRLLLWPRDDAGPPIRRLLDAPVRPVRAPNRTPDVGSGPWSFTYGGDESVRLFDPDLRDALELRGHSEPIAFLALSPDGRHVASASWDKSARIWDVVDEDMPRLLGHRGPITALAHGPDGAIVSAAHDGTMRVWDLETLTSREIAIDPQRPQDVAVSPDLRSAAIVRLDGRVVRFDLATGERTLLPRIDDAQMSCAQYLGDGRLVIGGGRKRFLPYYKADGTLADDRFSKRSSKTLAMARAPGRELVATAGRRDWISIWHEQDGQLFLRWRVSSVWKHALAFSHDGHRLAAGGDQGWLRIWDTRNVRRRNFEPVRLFDHAGRVTSVAWSPDDRWLASASTDGSARLWNTENGEAIAVLRTHRGHVNAVLFTADGRFLLTAGDGGAIQSWPTDLDELVALAEERVAAVQQVPQKFFDRVVDAAARWRRTDLLNEIAWQLVRRGRRSPEDVDLAFRAVRHAIELSDPPKHGYFRTLAKAHFRRQEYEDAVRWQEAALEAVRDDTTPFREEYAKAYSNELAGYREAATK